MAPFGVIEQWKQTMMPYLNAYATKRNGQEKEGALNYYRNKFGEFAQANSNAPWLVNSLYNWMQEAFPSIAKSQQFTSYMQDRNSSKEPHVGVIARNGSVGIRAEVPLSKAKEMATQYGINPNLPIPELSQKLIYADTLNPAKTYLIGDTQYSGDQWVENLRNNDPTYSANKQREMATQEAELDKRNFTTTGYDVLLNSGYGGNKAALDKSIAIAAKYGYRGPLKFDNPDQFIADQKATPLTYFYGSDMGGGAADHDPVTGKMRLGSWPENWQNKSAVSSFLQKFPLAYHERIHHAQGEVADNYQGGGVLAPREYEAYGHQLKQDMNKQGYFPENPADVINIINGTFKNNGKSYLPDPDVRPYYDALRNSPEHLKHFSKDAPGWVQNRTQRSGLFPSANNTMWS